MCISIYLTVRVLRGKQMACSQWVTEENVTNDSLKKVQAVFRKTKEGRHQGVRVRGCHPPQT